MNVRIKSMLMVISLCFMNINMPMNQPLNHPTTSSTPTSKTSYLSAFCQGAFAVGVFTATLGWVGYKRIKRLQADNTRLANTNRELEERAQEGLGEHEQRLRQEQERALKERRAAAQREENAACTIRGLQADLDSLAAQHNEQVRENLDLQIHVNMLQANLSKAENAKYHPTPTHNAAQESRAEQLPPPPYSAGEVAPLPRGVPAPESRRAESPVRAIPTHARWAGASKFNVHISGTAGRDTIVFGNGLHVPAGEIRLGGPAGGVTITHPDPYKGMAVFGGGNWQIGNGNVQNNH